MITSALRHPTFPFGSTTPLLSRDSSTKHSNLFGGLVSHSADSNLTALVLAPTKMELRRLLDLPHDWDGMGSPRPNENAVRLALVHLADFCQEAALTSYPWAPPHVSVSENEVILEWWKDELKLSLYVGEQSIEFIRVWGTNIDNEMNSGVLWQDSDFASLWHWLNT